MKGFASSAAARWSQGRQWLGFVRNWAQCKFPVAREPGQFLSRPLTGSMAAYGTREAPSLAAPAWQLVTDRQFDEPEYAAWCEKLGVPLQRKRKHWEWVYILETLRQNGMLQPGRRGVVFGCGKEPLPSLLAGMDVEVLATDLAFESREALGWWAPSGQHSSHLDHLYTPLCTREQFARRVSFRPCDMTRIPADIRDFDFLWSSCSLEHLGSLRAGMDFVLESLECLRPGGVAVHTTEFNLGSEQRTLASGVTCIYRRRDIEELAQELLRRGHGIGALNFDFGDRPPDRFVDLPPYNSPIHLKLLLMGHLTTSVGLFVIKGG